MTVSPSATTALTQHRIFQVDIAFVSVYLLLLFSLAWIWNFASNWQHECAGKDFYTQKYFIAQQEFTEDVNNL